MTTDNSINERLQLARDLVSALEQQDEAQADHVLDRIAGLREKTLFQEVGHLTRQLHDAMNSFSLDSKMTEMAEKDIPDAKERLNYVITMTEQAANQTLNVVEDLLPEAQQLTEKVARLSIGWERFLVREMPYEEFKEMSQEITTFFDYTDNALKKLHTGLNEILMAQGFQDITGQIIRRVIELVHDVENSLVELIKISGGVHFNDKARNEPDLPGPAIPGLDDQAGDVANSQDEVDDLLSSLGF